MDARRYAKWLHGMADYVDGISKSPDEKKRESFKRAREEQEKHHHKAAIELFKECLKRAESSNEKAALHLQIGNSLSHLGEGERALIAYQEALQATRTGDDEDGEAAALGNMGLVYAGKGELDKALSHHEDALKIHRKIGNPLGEANALGNIGFTLLRKGAKEDGCKALTSAHQLLIKLDVTPDDVAKVKSALDEFCATE